MSSVDQDSSSFELPKPGFDTMPSDGLGNLGVTKESIIDQGIEKGVSSATPVQPIADDKAASSVGVGGASALSPDSVRTSVASQTPQIADDADLIEKEWVIKAKQIVEQTKDDPRTQSKEISKVKSDYIKKRFNKDIKVSEN